MPIDSDGAWFPSVFPKQKEVMLALRPRQDKKHKRFILVNGPRWAGKTQSVQHGMCQVAWETDRANICILSLTQSVGIDSGVWDHLTKIFLPDWIGGDFGMEWVKKPFIQGVTKKPACIVRNQYGTETQFCLESLNNEDEVEDRFKGKAYSHIWVNELSKFKKRKTFDTLLQCLRMPHLRPEDQFLISDTNPDLDLGVQSEWYKLWYLFRSAEPEDFASIYPNLDEVDPKLLLPLRDSLELIEFTIDDNFALSPEQKAQKMAEFAHDPDLLAAYYYGKWTTASVDAIFHRVFRPKFHVVTDLFTEKDCYELQTGHDPGGVNYAAVIGEKVIPDIIQYPKYKGKPIFKVLEEQVVIGEDFDLYEFIDNFLKKMDEWEEVLERPGKIMWTHWSDRSVYDMKIPFLDKIWATEILLASQNRLRLIAAARGKGWVQVRVDWVRKLLFSERLFVDEEHCPNVIQMFKSLKKGTTVASVIERGSRFKHIFDALSYWLVSECVDELSMSMMNQRREKKTENATSLVQASL